MLIDNLLKPNQKKDFRKRIFIITGFFLSAIVLLLLRMAYVQIIQKSYYQRFAQGQTEQRIRIRANRGQILDRNGEVIVDNRAAYSIYITPAYLPANTKKTLKKRQALLKYLARKLNMSLKKLKSQVDINPRTHNKYLPVLINRDMDPRVYAELKENEKYLQGVTLEVIPIRRYLMGNSLSHSLGYTSMVPRTVWKSFQDRYKDQPEKNPFRDKDTIIGIKGLEKHQDHMLRGEDGLNIRLVNSLGQPISDSMEEVRKPQPGNNLFLTIDKRLQEVAKKAMTNKRGVLIVTKPSTGEILAMVSNPSFDPNIMVDRKNELIKKISHDIVNKPLFNRALQGIYAPSSIFKIVVATTALENRIFDHTKVFNCTGELYVGNRSFKCNDTHGRQNMIGAIEKSCNSYFYQLADEVGWSKIYKYAKKMGLGDAHELECGVSDDGIVPNNSWKKKTFNEPWFRGDTMNHSIGQGYCHLPPIQVHNIMSIIANNGVLSKPYLVKKVYDPVTQKEIITQPKLIAQIKLSPYTLRILNRGLRGVVESKGGTAPWARLSRKYLVAGKTGTAQSIIGMDPHAWFSCYAPQNSVNPNDRIAVTVIVENRKEGGGYISSPIATAMVKYYFEGTSLYKTSEEMGRNFVEAPLTPDTDNKPVYSTDIADEKRLKREAMVLQELRQRHNKLRAPVRANKPVPKARKVIPRPARRVPEPRKKIKKEKPNKKEIERIIEIENKRRRELEKKRLKKQKEQERRLKFEEAANKRRRILKERRLREKQIIKKKRPVDKHIKDIGKSTSVDIENQRLKRMIEEESKQFNKQLEQELDD